jgi:hypothetical protein
MSGDHADDGLADLTVIRKRRPRCLGIGEEDRFSGQAQERAQDIDTGLPVLLPVIGQPCHGVHSGQAYRRRLITAQPVRSCREPFV